MAEACLAVALVGVVLMVAHNELVLRELYSNASSGAVLLKSVITASSLALCALVTWFNYIHYKLYMVDNAIADWRLVVDQRKVAAFALELVVCLVHPLPGDWDFRIVTPAANPPPPSPFHEDGGVGADQSPPPQLPDPPPRLSADVVLSIPMFLRLYLFCRVLLLRSKLFADVRSQSLGALNRAKFNFYFIFKSLMYVHPISSLAFVVFCIFAINAWAMRLCEVGHEPLRSNYLNDLWLIAITFTSVGYGDLTPQTYCGRLISVVTGMLGAGCTALTCAVLAQKLELSRAEKSVNDFVIELELTKARKEAAARIIANGWRVHRARRGGRGGGAGGCSAAAGVHALERRLLRSIAEFHEVKKEQRKMADGQVTILELHRNQAAVAESLDGIASAQGALEVSLDELRGHVLTIGCRLDELRRRVAAKRRPASGGSAAAAAALGVTPDAADS